MKRKSLLILLLLALFAPWAANAQTTLFSEDFEGDSMPAGWTTDGSGTWTVGTGDYSSSTGAGNGTYNAKITHSNSGTVTKLITPEIDLSSVSSAELSFMHVQRSWSGDIDQLRVYYRTSSSGSWNQLVAYTTAFASWTTESGIVLPNLSSTYQLAFEHTDKYGYGVGVDNIVIVQGASCPKPAGLAATLNGQSVTLTWTSDATSFSVAHSMDASAEPADNIVATVSSATYTMNNLTLDEDHYFWVRVNCSGSDQSDWSDPVSVHVGYCVPAPSSVDNDGISNVTFGIGENVVNNDTPKAMYADYHNLVGAVYAGIEATIAITFKTGYTYNTFVWVDFDNSLSFEADEVVCYGESTNANPTTLTLNFTIPATQTSGDFRLRIGSADSGLESDPADANPCYTGMYGCFQDYTLRVLETPSCLPPTGLAASDVTAHEATISWTSDASAWQIQLGEATPIDVTEPTYTFTGLAPETAYSAKVRANCGGDYSDWSSPVSFTTSIACFAPTGLVTSNIFGHGATITWTAEEGAMYQCALAKTAEYDPENINWSESFEGNTQSWTNLDPETGYTFALRKDCGSEDGYSTVVTRTFTTTVACPAPTNLNVTDGSVTAREATVTWEGTSSDGYVVMISEVEEIIAVKVDFETGDLNQANFITNSYPFTVVANTHSGAYCAKSGNGGLNSSTSDMVLEVTLAQDATLTFSAKVSSESGYDKAYFSIDGVDQSNLSGISGNGNWIDYTYPLTAGTHSLRWYYTKDNSQDYFDDCFYVDDIVVIAAGMASWTEYTTANPTYTFENLTPDTDYQVKVKGNCGDDGYSAETATVRFTTTVACPAPTGLAIAANSLTGHKADLTWEGTSTSYTLNYRTKAYVDGIEERFDTPLVTPSGWERYSGLLSDGTATMTQDNYGWAFTPSNDVFDNHAVTNVYGDGQYWLVVPAITLPANSKLNFDLALTGFSVPNPSTQGTDDKFIVLISTDGMTTWTTLREWNNSGSEHVYNDIDNTAIGQNVSIDLSAYVGQSVRIAFYSESTITNADNNLHIDNVIIGNPVVAGEWMTVTTHETTAELTNLDPETLYEAYVIGICEGEGESRPSNTVTFTTAEACLPVGTLAKATEVKTTSAKLSWTLTDDTQDLWEVAYTTSSHGDNYNHVEANTNNGFLLENLTPETLYYVKVRAICGDEDGNSGWSNEIFFTTKCNVITVDAENDYIDTFENSYFMCWDFTNPTNNYEWNISPQNHTTASSSYSAYSGLYGPNYLTMPELAIADYKTDVKLTFWSYNTFTSAYTAEKQAKNSVVLIDGTNETELWYAESVSNSWVETTIDLSAYKGQTIRLAFKYEGDDAHAWYVDDVKVAFDPSCLPVGTLADAIEVKATSAKLNWILTDNTQDLWQVAYSHSPLEAGYQFVAANTNIGFLLENLTPETTYYVKVRANCGDEDGYSDWSNEITFTTLASCFTPYDIVVGNITPISADLTWIGESNEYNILCTEKVEPSVILFEGFENADDFANWQAFGNVNTNTGNRFGRLTTAPKTDTYHFSFSSYSPASDYNQYLISPEVNAGGGNLEFYYRMSAGSSAGENFEVGYSTSGNTVSDFTWFEPSVTCASLSYQKYSKENLPAGTKYIAIHYFQTTDRYQLFIDDIKITASVTGTGTVIAVNSTTESVTLEGLEANKTYEVKVQGVCEGVAGEWSQVYEFTTMGEGKVFVTEGNWNEAANWRPQGVPALTDNVYIRANVTIPAGCVALANEMTVAHKNNSNEQLYTITIEDGGQLLHSSPQVYATMQKVVKPYETDGTDNYILLASPMQPTVFAEDVENLLPLWYTNAPATFNVDFYKFDQNEEYEWVNLENISAFPITKGEGYLYAHNWSSDVTLSFKDALMHGESDYKLLDYIDGKSFAGWNLIGNPFPCNATISITGNQTVNYYKINANGEWLTASGAVAPMEGIFVQVDQENLKATFTRVVPGENSTAPTDGILNINLMTTEAASRKGNSRIDMARLRFGQGNNLGKFSIYKTDAQVSIQHEGKDCAVAYAEGMGEVPVSFKAEKNGTYTLGFTTEDVTFNYLHLIDNLTGTDTDLLATPSYSFDARTTDYASRFRLVFATGSTAEGDSFAFIDAAGNIIINGAEAGTVMQIMDVTGRMILSTNVVRNVSTNGMAPGVYMLRLINGDNVKTQKIVVR